ncbi:RNA-binding (RRM/RBD/RNP motifs) family protein [Striga asiatica]|uniref:RNA-binding (RRM/RBD/RNP motifs) family protein n=1 Tax=Striga asiatica TaxID=4170 RepID=A0A5A7Q7S9_STRAF|nr:RNA-binding (RRM/RBD/RNP motifs) family protein [Striga asiatica]
MVEQALISWAGMGRNFTSWEDSSFIRSKFPTFYPCGQGSSDPAGIVVIAELIEEGNEAGKQLGFEEKMKEEKNEQDEDELGIKDEVQTRGEHSGLLEGVNVASSQQVQGNG